MQFSFTSISAALLFISSVQAAPQGGCQKRHRKPAVSVKQSSAAPITTPIKDVVLSGVKNTPAASLLPKTLTIPGVQTVSSSTQLVKASNLPISAPVLAEVPSSTVHAATSTTSTSSVPSAKSGKYPFNQIVAYGDELSDNGNGSYAHGITGDPANVYGFGTWTNGPVAVSYLSDLLVLGSNGLVDYAFGGCCGGGDFGATLDSAYTESPAGAPSLVQQISNYTSVGKPNIANTLQFIWIGENDLSKHTDAFWLGDPQNAAFATKISEGIAASVKALLDDGAAYVFVANIYPKHIAPVTAKYLCGAPQNDCVTTWGKIIVQANDAIKASLAPFGTKAIYYDSFSFISNLSANAAANGFTKPLAAFCDGDGDASWNDCMVLGNAPQYFWMNFIQPTTRVHQLIAKDMKSTIDQHFGL